MSDASTLIVTGAIEEALARHDAAAQALANAEAAHGLALAEADKAAERLASIVEAEHADASAFVDRIRASVASGSGLAREKPTARATERAEADAHHRKASAAASLLGGDVTAARADLGAAKLGLDLATQQACRDQASAIARVALEAAKVLEQAHVE